MIKDIYQHKVVKINPKPSLEVTAISVRFGTRNLYIFSIYQPCNRNTDVIDCSVLRHFFNMAKDSTYPEKIIFNFDKANWKTIGDYLSEVLINAADSKL